MISKYELAIIYLIAIFHSLTQAKPNSQEHIIINYTIEKTQIHTIICSKYFNFQVVNDIKHIGLSLNNFDSYPDVNYTFKTIFVYYYCFYFLKSLPI